MRFLGVYITARIDANNSSVYAYKNGSMVASISASVYSLCAFGGNPNNHYT